MGSARPGPRAIGWSAIGVGGCPDCCDAALRLKADPDFAGMVKRYPGLRMSLCADCLALGSTRVFGDDSDPTSPDYDPTSGLPATPPASSPEMAAFLAHARGPVVSASAPLTPGASNSGGARSSPGVVGSSVPGAAPANANGYVESSAPPTAWSSAQIAQSPLPTGDQPEPAPAPSVSVSAPQPPLVTQDSLSNTDLASLVPLSNSDTIGTAIPNPNLGLPDAAPPMAPAAAPQGAPGSTDDAGGNGDSGGGGSGTGSGYGEQQARDRRWAWVLIALLVLLVFMLNETEKSEAQPQENPS